MMPLIAIHKARKSKIPVVRGYGLAETYVNRLARSYYDTSKKLVSSQILSDIQHAYVDGDIEKALDAIPWRQEPTKGQQEIFAQVVQRSGQEAFDEIGWKAKFQIKKDFVTTVPLNPYSSKWLAEHGAELVKEITSSQQETIRMLLMDGLSKGLHPNTVAKQIRANIGLLSREANAVERRRQLSLDKGLPTAKADKIAERYGSQLLRKRSQRIARTELIRAQAKGQHDAWILSREEGVLGNDMWRQWVSDSASQDPNRPCQICLELGEMDPMPIGTPWESSFEGSIMEPPAHPSCRCTVALVRVPNPEQPPAPPAALPEQPLVPEPVLERPQLPMQIESPSIATTIAPSRMPTTAAWAASLTIDELEAFNSWSGKGYNQMRKVAVGEAALASKAGRNLQAMTQALERAPNYKGTAHRGMILNASEAAKAFKEGSVITINAPTSFSAKKEIASLFTNVGKFDPKQDVKIVISTKVSDKANSIAHPKVVGARAAEKEIVVGKDKQFVVKKVEKVGHRWNVLLEELPNATS